MNGLMHLDFWSLGFGLGFIIFPKRLGRLDFLIFGFWSKGKAGPVSLFSIFERLGSLDFLFFRRDDRATGDRATPSFFSFQNVSILVGCNTMRMRCSSWYSPSLYSIELYFPFS